MLVNFNTGLSDALSPDLVAVQRAMFYADSLFETIRVFDRTIPLLNRHWARLSNGMTAMGYELPRHWNADFFYHEIQKIAPVNARARLTVWRSPGGLYAPENQLPLFLITGQKLHHNSFDWPESGIVLGVCQTVRLPVDSFSNLKTLNTARYVAAARAARSNGWDDALLFNSRDRICEATSSNVFWWEGETLCTIPLAEGCVAGVLREFLLEMTTRKGFDVREKPATFATIQQAEEIFLTNAIRGIIPVRIFAGRTLSYPRTKILFDLISEQIHAGA